MISRVSVIKQYYQLTKPGIVYGNAISTIGAFFLASGKHINWWLGLATVTGTALIIASACVFNNYFDQDIDAKMSRTKHRALASAAIEEEYALIYASILGIIGTIILSLWVNRLTVFIGMLGWISYVWWYTSLKRKTWHATLIGTLPGATPIVAGYTAVTGRIDLGAILLFLIMVMWQMPHFYAIAVFRRDDYAAARVPVITVVKGIRATVPYIVWYTAGFAVATTLLALYGYASFSFFIILAVISLYWLSIGFRGFHKNTDTTRWARKMFGLSLFTLLILSLTLAINPWLP